MASGFPAEGGVVLGCLFGFGFIMYVIQKTYNYFANKNHKLPELSHIEDDREAERERERKRIAILEAQCIGKPVTRWDLSEHEGAIEVPHVPIEPRLKHGDAHIQLPQPRGSNL